MSILAIIVLYRRAPSESQSLCSILRILQDSPEVANEVSLVVYDNSPQNQSDAVPGSFSFHYIHNSINAGLAAAYNYGLGHAERAGHEWLLLFDQDTSPTDDFFAELIAATRSLHTKQDVAAIVPKLVVDGKIYSPAAHFIDQMRHQYRRSTQAVGPEVAGVQQGRLGAYNSGAALRVSAIRSVGGFPEEYWLDYLDHAVFHTLSSQGYRMYVMRAMLEHEASHKDVSSVPPLWRFRNVLAAQTRFVKQTGNLADRLLYRIWLLRYSRSLFRFCSDRRFWKEAALQSLRLKVQTTTPPGRPSPPSE